MTTTQAVLLAGGLGTRIAGLSGGRPKVLLPVGGRPFLHHLLDWLAARGIERVLLLTGVGADEVEMAARVGAPAGLELSASREAGPLGTGGALRLALPKLDARFFLLNGDTFFDADLAALEAAHLAAAPGGVLATLGLVRFPDAREKGSVELDAAGHVARFVEKGREGPGLINGGLYLIERPLVAHIPEGRAVSLEREVLPGLIDIDGRPGLMGVVFEARFVDIGLPADYLGVKDGIPQGQ
jgi:NDP-sugar pyrophosphorylase family protein